MLDSLSLLYPAFFSAQIANLVLLKSARSSLISPLQLLEASRLISKHNHGYDHLDTSWLELSRSQMEIDKLPRDSAQHLSLDSLIEAVLKEPGHQLSNQMMSEGSCCQPTNLSLSPNSKKCSFTHFEPDVARSTYWMK